MCNTAMLEYDVYIASKNRNLASKWQRAPIEDPRTCGVKIRAPNSGTVSIGLQ